MDRIRAGVPDSSAAVRALMGMEFSERDAWLSDDDEAFSALVDRAGDGPAFVLPRADNPLCVCGVVRTFGVGTLWMVTSRRFVGSPERRGVIAQQRQMIRTLYGALGLHRLQMTVVSGDGGAARYAAFLGFYHEATLRAFGPNGEDQEIWAYFNEETKGNVI